MDIPIKPGRGYYCLTLADGSTVVMGQAEFTSEKTVDESGKDIIKVNVTIPCWKIGSNDGKKERQ